ncbi:MAG: polyprenol monophosphomannose synthase [Nanoarchaeota archaeon]|nr:polyprenol monophosphomannose synthase [Nanoarchaeota archaeon]MBU1849727.1 polyprenol monophosphomannose synthase [Nanoarchaeota archaeon]
MFFSIIIPTYNEAESIDMLIPKIYDVLNKHYNYEIVVMDDNSPDGTADIVRRLSKKYPVRVVVRKKNKGLSAAVIDGFKASKGDVFCVMDADLSHPPKVLPKIFAAIKSYDVIVGSRLVSGGGSEKWPFHRKLISWGAQLLSKPLTKVKDTMSGFFAVKKSVVLNAPLEALGYKILLEILVKGNYKSVTEIPFTFLNRSFGESKISMKVQMEYLKQLCHLYRFKFFK